jgi:hypothetical protein
LHCNVQRDYDVHLTPLIVKAPVDSTKFAQVIHRGTPVSQVQGSNSAQLKAQVKKTKIEGRRRFVRSLW